MGQVKVKVAVKGKVRAEVKAVVADVKRQTARDRVTLETKAAVDADLADAVEARAPGATPIR